MNRLGFTAKKSDKELPEPFTYPVRKKVWNKTL
jgi:hypothetical protein